MKYTLTLRQSRPFAQTPRSVELEGECILLNDVNLPEHIEHTFNPYNIRLWVIGHEFGALCATWASCEQDALDAAVDAGMLDGLMADLDDADGDYTPLGNASELFDLTRTWLAEVYFDPARDIKLIIDLVRQDQTDNKTLD